ACVRVVSASALSPGFRACGCTGVLRRARTLPRMRVDDFDEFEHGFGWIADEFMQRCSHALVADGRVWLIDALDRDGLDVRVRGAGAPAGVIQLLDRHHRDCAALA